jgi:predicted RNase H-like HicB family nuclease
MLNLNYSLVIEATDDSHFFAFYSPDLEGFTGTGESIEDCLEKARIGVKEHLALMKEKNLPIPTRNLNPTVTIKDTRPVRQGA